MNRIIVTLIFLLTALVSLSQRYTPYLKYDKSIQNIGQIHEEKGVVKIDYTFTNTGTKPLIINQIKTSTTRIKAEWTKKPILPQKKGCITLIYNPQNAKGGFHRTITVLSNAKNNVSILRISGIVIPRPLTTEEKYPLVMEQLRFKKNGNRLYFNNIKNTEKRIDTIEFINFSNEEISLAFEYLPKHIKVKITPEKLQPKQKGMMLVELDASKIRDLGYNYNRLPLKINNTNKYENNIIVNSIVLEDFSKLTKEQLANAPKVKFESYRFLFGTIEKGQKITHKFYFQNKGKSDLIIRKVKAGCGCTPFALTKRYIKPGEKSFIEVTFDSKNRRGRQHKFITFICNDPVNHTTKLEVIGNIISKTK